MSEKIKSQHVGRKALLYIRQSSIHQVNHNLESQKLQYGMQERLHLLGWRQIEVIDEDLSDSMEDQLGLTLQRARVPFETIVIDYAENPSPN